MAARQVVATLAPPGTVHILTEEYSRRTDMREANGLPYDGIEPRTRAFLEEVNAQGGPPLYTLSPKQARGVLSGLQAMPVARPPADIEERTISGEADRQVSIQIVRPAGVEGILPA